MDFRLRGGALLIGSLYWQDDLNLEMGDEIRKKWRERHLQMDASVSVRVPIRYGRFSGSAEKNTQTYTMIFDSALSDDEYGRAKAIPFRREVKTSFSEIADEVREISRAEGKGDTFVKGREAWCICGVTFHPRIQPSVKEHVLEEWQKKLKVNNGGYHYIQNRLTDYSVRASGELAIPWPREADHLDFLVGTATRKSMREGVHDLTPQEIADYIHDGRPYFIPNREHGIITARDEEILACYNC